VDVSTKEITESLEEGVSGRRVLMHPEHLYKYRSWRDENHRRLLTQNEIFFASAREFNDPFDSTIPIDFSGGTKDEYLEMAKRGVRSDHRELKEKEVLWRAREAMNKGLYKDPENIRQHRIHVQEDRFNSFGIVSLSEVPDSILMWAHYADSHRGFCVGFDFQKIDLMIRAHAEGAGQVIFLKSVEYHRDYPHLNRFEMDSEQLLVLPFIIKSVAWNYEKEWRLILAGETNKPFRFTDGIVRKVILGCKMQVEEVEEVKQVLRNRADKIALFQAREKEGSFGLDFDRIQY
jgi:hypothetical protein